MKYLRIIFNWFIGLFSNIWRKEKPKLSETDKMIMFTHLMIAHDKANATGQFLDDVAKKDPKIAYMFEKTEIK